MPENRRMKNSSKLPQTAMATVENRHQTRQFIQADQRIKQLRTQANYQAMFGKCYARHRACQGGT